jgi:hypothetical protein
MKITLQDVETFLSTSKYGGKDQVICNIECILEDAGEDVANIEEFIEDNVRIYKYVCEHCERSFQYDELSDVENKKGETLFCCDKCRNKIEGYKKELIESDRWDSLSPAEQAAEMIENLDKDEQNIFCYIENELEKKGFEIYHVSKGSVYFERESNDKENGYEKIRISNHAVNFNPMKHNDDKLNWHNTGNQIIIFDRAGNLRSIEKIKLQLQNFI